MDEKQKITTASNTGAYTIATSVVAMVAKGLTTDQIAANMERVIKETESSVPKYIQDALLAVHSEYVESDSEHFNLDKMEHFNTHKRPSTVVTPDAPKTEGFKFA